MYSQKSELGKDMIAWKEYGPEPWGTTGISYAAAILTEREDDQLVHHLTSVDRLTQLL